MPYNIIIYCPDKHILYDANTPDKQGVGGGLMARIRLAQALSRLGHQVTIISNVKRFEIYQGIKYLPLDCMEYPNQTDILIMITSGDALNLENVASLNIRAHLREVWVQGTIPVMGISEAHPDVIIAASNFLYQTIRAEWNVGAIKSAVIYNGASYSPPQWFERVAQRDPYSLAYTSHPSKGLNAAIGVLNILREREPRFKLHVFGGDRLWGGVDQKIDQENLIYHGTQGQQTVLRALRSINFSMNLQQRLEPFGMVLTEAMLAGCVPIASPVGAYSELIKDCQNGFLITGDSDALETQHKTANQILHLVKVPHYMEYVRQQAQNIPWTWNTQAKVWIEHWDWLLNQKGELLNGQHVCRFCQGDLLLMADGHHCAQCGRYLPELRSI